MLMRCQRGEEEMLERCQRVARDVGGVGKVQE